MNTSNRCGYLTLVLTDENKDNLKRMKNYDENLKIILNQKIITRMIQSI